MQNSTYIQRIYTLFTLLDFLENDNNALIPFQTTKNVTHRVPINNSRTSYILAAKYPNLRTGERKCSESHV